MESESSRDDNGEVAMQQDSFMETERSNFKFEDIMANMNGNV